MLTLSKLYTLRNFLFLIFIFTAIYVHAQESFKLSGSIIEDTNQEPILGANIKIANTDLGTTSDFDGLFSFQLAEGTYLLEFSYLGFETEVREIILSKDTYIEVILKTSDEQLSEIIITENLEKTDIRSASISVNSLKAETIKKIPVVLGEPDVLRSLVQLPGVSNAGEAASGFNVRGGGADQNLVLLDDAVIFNSSHLFGLFSIFNPDAIKDLTLYKGGIPSKYGGRVSSVLDVKQRTGNTETYKGEANLGLVSSKLLVEGPIQKEKSSFLISGRSSYAHLFLALADNPNSAYFYDVNAKFNFKSDDKNRFLVSAYYGRDVFNINENFINVYGTSFVNFRWNHVYSENLFSNMSLVLNDYLYALDLNSVGFEFDSGVRNINWKYDFSHIISNTTQLTYGIDTFLHEFNPGNIRPNSPDSGINPRQLNQQYAWESAAYIGVEQDIIPKLKVAYGLRLSAFYRLGQTGLNEYENNLPVIYNAALGIYEQADPIGVENISRSSILHSFYNPEPRASFAYTFNEDTSVKVGYNRMVQNLHLITNTSSPTPLDVWTPSGEFIKPQRLDQVSVGYFKNFKKEAYSLETEVFYRTASNSIDFIDGANLIANDAIEREILNGEARAYGVELLLRKNTGKLTGWIAYTLSKSEQRTPGRTADEPGINNGEWYLNNFDKPHDISVVASYELNKKWTFNSNIIYQTGLPVNFPVGQYQFQDLTVPVFEGRNLNRLPDYYRLDLAATLIPSSNANRDWKTSWTFSVYNVFNRMNATAINFRQDQTTGANEAVRLAIFGAVPSVSYNIKF